MTDAASATDTEDFTITLTGANDAPEITDVGSGAKASVLVHGVRFTVNEAGEAGNDWMLDIGTTSGQYVVEWGGGNNRHILFKIDSNVSPISSDKLLAEWNRVAPTELKNLITATREGPNLSAPYTEVTAFPRTSFSGGTDGGDAVILTDVANDATNTPSVSGDFGVDDPDNEEGEGGSRPPGYAILDGTGADAAFVSVETTNTYSIVRNGITWGGDHPQPRHGGMGIHR